MQLFCEPAVDAEGPPQMPKELKGQRTMQTNLACHFKVF